MSENLLVKIAVKQSESFQKSDRDLVQMAFDEIVEMEQFDGTVKENDVHTL